MRLNVLVFYKDGLKEKGMFCSKKSWVYIFSKIILLRVYDKNMKEGHMLLKGHPFSLRIQI